MYGDTQNTGATRYQCSLDISTFRVSYKAMTKTELDIIISLRQATRNVNKTIFCVLYLLYKLAGYFTKLAVDTRPKTNNSFFLNNPS